MHKPDSIATAAGGALIAQLQGGAWAGDPRAQAISFGVLRPVRPLALGRPMGIAGWACRACWCVPRIIAECAAARRNGDRP
jgi:hypothetical protein